MISPDFLQRVGKFIFDNAKYSIPTFFEGFRIQCTPSPHKSLPLRILAPLRKSITKMQSRFEDPHALFFLVEKTEN